MGRIPEETIERVAAANDIVEVIGGYFPLKRAGSAFRALCPFHSEKSPSFHVNPQRQIFNCFGCGAKGSVFGFVMQYESIDYPTAIKRLAERAHIIIVEQEFTPTEQRKVDTRRRLLALHHEAAKWFHTNLLKSGEASEARKYLKGRGLNREIAGNWQIGYAPDSWDACVGWAEEAGFNPHELEESGLVGVSEKSGRLYDRFRGRIMFPICNDLGEAIAFSGRTLEANPQAAKYVNSPETMLFTKGNVLFGLHRSKRALINAKSAIVCEGQLDLIAAFESGVENVIAPQGTAFTGRQAQILKRFVEEVVLCFDSDAAGMKAAERSLPALLDAGLFVRVAEMPPGHDPDSLIREQGPEAFRERTAQARDFFDYQIERYASEPDFASARGKLDLARRVAGWVSLVTDPVMRDLVIHRTVSRLGLAEPEFRNLLRQPRRGRESDETVPPIRQGAPLNPTMKLICLLALRDDKARERLRGAEVIHEMGAEAGASLLGAILGATFDGNDDAAARSFADTRPEEEREQIFTLLLADLPEQREVVLEDCLRGLERENLQRRQEQITSRLRLPDLLPEEVAKLQREVQAIRQRLNELRHASN